MVRAAIGGAGMRELRHLVNDVDRQLEDAVRAKQELDAAQWREQLRPAAMRRFAARTVKLRWSRALVKLLIEELHPDDLFTELVGHIGHVQSRRWPQVIAIAVALRHSWRREGLTSIARQLHVSLASDQFHNNGKSGNTRPSRPRLSGSPQACQGFPLRSNPLRGCRP
jgi:hypothetical protein